MCVNAPHQDCPDTVWSGWCPRRGCPHTACPHHTAPPTVGLPGSAGRCWCTRNVTYAAAKPPEIPTGLSGENSDLPETAPDTTMANSNYGIICSSQASLFPQASLETFLHCEKFLQEPKVLLMSSFFISLLCWYLGQDSNERAQIFHKLLNQGLQSTNLYLS